MNLSLPAASYMSHKYQAAVVSLLLSAILLSCSSGPSVIPYEKKWPGVLEELDIAISGPPALQRRIGTQIENMKPQLNISLKEGIMKSQRVILLDRENLSDLLEEEELTQQGIATDTGFDKFKSGRLKIFCNMTIAKPQRRKRLNIEASCQSTNILTSEIMAVKTVREDLSIRPRKQKESREELAKLLRKVAYGMASQLPYYNRDR